MRLINQKRKLGVGFTLVELLVALFVFSLLSAFAYRAINTMLKTGDSLEAEMQALTDVQRALQIIERDLRQRVVYSSSELNNNTSELSVELNTDKTSLELNRLSSSLQNQAEAVKYIRYSFAGDQLLRESWLYAKDSLSDPSDKSVLLTGLKSAEFSLPEDSKSTSAAQQWPNYIEVKLDHKELGGITRTIGLFIKQADMNLSSLTEPESSKSKGNDSGDPSGQLDECGNPFGTVYAGSQPCTKLIK